MVKNTKRIVRNGKEYEINLEEGWDNPQVLEASKVLIKHIIETNGERISYSEFCEKLSFKPHPEFVDKLFGPLSYSCIESGLPPASGIVVKKGEYFPGAGFIKYYYPHINGEDAKLKKQLEVVKEIEEFKDWDVMLEAMNLL